MLHRRADESTRETLCGSGWRREVQSPTGPLSGVGRRCQIIDSHEAGGPRRLGSYERPSAALPTSPSSSSSASLARGRVIFSILLIWPRFHHQILLSTPSRVSLRAPPSHSGRRPFSPVGTQVSALEFVTDRASTCVLGIWPMSSPKCLAM